MYDLVIRNGLVVDGTGTTARHADIGITGATITQVGDDITSGRRELDAAGLLVTPGWVDIHTHYDGQATWDSELAPSSWHGVTTAVFGNCAVGFAPVRPGAEPFLINLMEGVEDIPGSVLSEGVDFQWESFPEYLDAVASRPRTMDVGAQVPHGALRFYVMGDRGADHAERPTTAEIDLMGSLVGEALEAGALGFSTSRTKKHRAKDGRATPSLTASDEELLGIAAAMSRAGRGVIQANSDFNDPEEIAVLRRMGEVSGRPVSFSLLQVDHDPERWRSLLAAADAATAAGVTMRAQVSSRAVGVFMGLGATVHPLLGNPAFQEVAHLPLDDLVRALRDPDRRARALAQPVDHGFGAWAETALAKTFDLGDALDYEPDPSSSIGAAAAKVGCSARELAYDLLLEDEGHKLLYYPFENYSYGNLDTVREMLLAPNTVAGLSDGGAHVATVCDASFPTFLLTHWVRDRTRGDRLPLELVVRKQTRDTALTVGLTDRGAILPGLRADLNVIDLDALRLGAPTMTNDLPAGGRRLVQGAVGYRHTFVAGMETYTDGEPTGATPGRLVRPR